MAGRYETTTLTLAANTAQRLSDLLAAEGYTGSMIGKFLELEDVNSLGDVYRGADNTVSSANGRLLTIYTRTSGSPSQPVDPGGVWLKSVTGGDIACTFEAY